MQSAIKSLSQLISSILCYLWVVSWSLLEPSTSKRLLADKGECSLSEARRHSYSQIGILATISRSLVNIAQIYKLDFGFHYYPDELTPAVATCLISHPCVSQSFLIRMTPRQPMLTSSRTKWNKQKLKSHRKTIKPTPNLKMRDE